MNIVLVGLMGSGKSSVGRLLAAMLGWPFVDTDSWVEAQAGKPIPELFAAEGEAAFRAREAAAVAELCAGPSPGPAGAQPGPGALPSTGPGPGWVIATGGGAVLAEANRTAMRQGAIVVWLDASPEELYRRAVAQGAEHGVAGRPLLAGANPLERLREMAAARAGAYRAAAHLRVETDGKDTAAVAEIIRRLVTMREVNVNLGERSYRILIGPGLLGQVGRLVHEVLPKARRALIITDSNVGPLFAATVQGSLAAAGMTVSLATVPAGEQSKSFVQAQFLYGECVRAALDRSTSVIITLGGGVVGDLGGFVAATFLRGIPFVQVPTSLLAQVDSSVGGKTAVDLPEGKNLVGAFHQPSLVVADVTALTALPHREFSTGLGEVVKHGVIRDPGFLAWLEQKADAVLAVDPAEMAELVAINCGIKAAVVAADEREGGLRAILNFGHTVGHAVEASMGYGGWGHGQCVAVGMLAATEIARLTGVLQEPDLGSRLEKLLQRLELPTRLPADLDLAALEPLMQRDKKVEGGRVKWVLPVRTGEMIVTPDVTAEAVRQGILSLRG